MKKFRSWLMLLKKITLFAANVYQSGFLDVVHLVNLFPGGR
jgi:hypothetical protein